ncbi:hypothetical protein [Cupriavidus sp. amp6]|uniref:hypothetical protein n=1 Tax=Cupriavidus sp. amp6 TaxID=388051 RepID=UPI0012EBD389|nr:hypothetical protein [Cupriavidus sp. amp6]
MAEIKVILRTADLTRKAEIAVRPDNLGADIIQAAVDNWNLPTDTDYSLVHTGEGRALVPTTALSASGVKDGDILEVQPVLVAGVTP